MAALGEHAARFSGGAPGVLQGSCSYLLQDDDGQVALTHSVSAGLDYASVGPEHAWLHDQGRAEYCSCQRRRGAGRRQDCSPHRRASFPRSNPPTPLPRPSAALPPPQGKIFVVNLSGRGDKDIDIYRENIPELDAAQ